MSLLSNGKIHFYVNFKENTSSSKQFLKETKREEDSDEEEETHKREFINIDWIGTDC